MDISALWTAEGLLSLVTLSAMEIVLGIDNIVFLTILTGKLPPTQQPRARRIGLILALGTRVLLLLGISWVMGLTRPLFELFAHPVSGRDLILLGGGAFLIAKATKEIHEKIEVKDEEAHALAHGSRAFGLVLVQIALFDIVFSLDSVITAVGMARELAVMVTAMVIAMIVMLLFAGKIGDFVHRHPTMKVLALSFLILIGVMLVAEGMGQHVAKGYIYFAMAFSLVVELLNLRMQKASAKVDGPLVPADHGAPAEPSAPAPVDPVVR